LKQNGFLSVTFGKKVTTRPVSARVGNVKNNDHSLIEPVTAVITAAQ
jgi:hypothetical protein